MPLRTKEKYAKVRTGCLTCKKRHVKCDELRPPPCGRCLKGGYKCGGYTDLPKAWVFEYEGPPKSSQDGVLPVQVACGNVVPKTESKQTNLGALDTLAPSESRSEATTENESQRVTFSQALLHMQTLSRTRPSGPYKSFEEQRAFKHFVEVCVPIVKTYSDPTVWDLSIPQAAWSHPAIKHSLIATALVNESMAIERRRPRYGHDGRALYHVNCAIRALTESTPSTEIIITAGLILQFMEAINNNAKIAYLHLMSAVRICNEFKERVARGERVRAEQADLILNHLDPTLKVALKFAEVILKQNLGQESIDQWTPEAFDLKQSLVTERPGNVESFRNTMDARNNYGVLAVKLMSFRATVRDFQAGTSHAMVDFLVQTRIEAQRVRRVMDHCARLLRPIHDKYDIESSMLQVHDQILRSIFRDTVGSLEIEETLGPEIDYTEVLEQVLHLIYVGKAYEEKDLMIELGVIPPLFYLATASGCHAIDLRRRAISCLTGPLAGRREGYWTGLVAGRIADEILDLEVELEQVSNLLRASNHHFDIIIRSHDKLSQDNDLSQLDAENVGLCPQLWLSYKLTSRTDPKAFNSGNALRTWRLCPSWGPSDIANIPKNINELIQDYGYQGYFADAVNITDRRVTAARRISGNGIPFRR